MMVRINGLVAVDVRERNLETLNPFKETSLDFYATIRSVYQQARNREISGQQLALEALPDF
jgi:ABC-type transporter lipoprotein component MlaA